MCEGVRQVAEHKSQWSTMAKRGLSGALTSEDKKFDKSAYDQPSIRISSGYSGAHVEELCCSRNITPGCAARRRRISKKSGKKGTAEQKKEKRTKQRKRTERERERERRTNIRVGSIKRRWLYNFPWVWTRVPWRISRNGGRSDSLVPSHRTPLSLSLSLSFSPGKLGKNKNAALSLYPRAFSSRAVPSGWTSERTDAASKKRCCGALIVRGNGPEVINRARLLP